MITQEHITKLADMMLEHDVALALEPCPLINLILNPPTNEELDYLSIPMYIPEVANA